MRDVPIGPVNILVAMPSEARPLIDHWRLTRARDAGPFVLYEGDRARLIVSGVGATAAAAAAGFLFARSGAQRDQAWLNLGVAGHPKLGVGTITMAHKVVDAATGRSWYPPRVHWVPCPPAEVRTVPKAEREYADPVVYEMEAAGFVAACSRFSVAEQVQVVKIISDNLASGIDTITRERIGEWIAAQLPVIDTVVAAMADTAADLATWNAPPPELESFAERWRFSVTQTHELRDLLRRWRLCLPTTEAWSEVRGLADSRAVLAHLRERLAAAPPRLEQPQ